MEEDDLFRDHNYDPSIVPDKWYYFEVMDRAHGLLNQVEHAFYNHPGLDEEASKKAKIAFQMLFELYQYGGLMIDKDEDDQNSAPW